jgi:hypothetical protein
MPELVKVVLMTCCNWSDKCIPELTLDTNSMTWTTTIPLPLQEPWWK